MREKDYFCVETIRDKEGNEVCQYLTVIGTIESGGAARMRMLKGRNGETKRAFGFITLCNQDRKIETFCQDKGLRVRESYDTELDGHFDVINFSAGEWRADRVYEYEEGDRVLLEGRLYINHSNGGQYTPELTINVSSSMKLGRKKMQSFLPKFKPQKISSYE